MFELNKPDEVSSFYRVGKIICQFLYNSNISDAEANQCEHLIQQQDLKKVFKNQKKKLVRRIPKDYIVY
jgi:hypothetical protein